MCGFDHATSTLRIGTLQKIQIGSFAQRSFSAIPCAGNNMVAQPVEIDAPRAATTIAQQIHCARMQCAGRRTSILKCSASSLKYYVSNLKYKASILKCKASSLKYCLPVCLAGWLSVNAPINARALRLYLHAQRWRGTSSCGSSARRLQREAAARLRIQCAGRLYADLQ